MGYAHAAEAAGHTDVAEETMAQLRTLLTKGDRGAMQGHSMQGRSSERP
jgi:hypothetical protein